MTFLFFPSLPKGLIVVSRLQRWCRPEESQSRAKDGPVKRSTVNEDKPLHTVHWDQRGSQRADGSQ